MATGPMKSLPPLNPLHVFAVVARCGSFTKAAEELRVTQSAVSRQIATLESYLGTRLFRRQQRGIALSAVGSDYANRIEGIFDAISAATTAVVEGAKSKPVRLRVYTTFASKWLIPRLPLFHREHPHIQVRLSTAVAPVDFARDNVDLAIQVGHGKWPGMTTVRLFGDVLQPICSPNLLRQGVAAVDIGSLNQLPLLHSHYRRDDWPDWLAGVGRSDINVDSGTSFTSSILTYQAAEQGMGIAIGQINLLEQEFAAGTLIRLFDRPIERDQAYYVVWPRDAPLNRKLRTFVSWLKRQNAPSAAAAAPSAAARRTQRADTAIPSVKRQASAEARR
jgi:LysR family glycine cleavage system transcriptional activator